MPGLGFQLAVAVGQADAALRQEPDRFFAQPSVLLHGELDLVRHPLWFGLNRRTDKKKPVRATQTGQVFPGSDQRIIASPACKSDGDDDEDAIP
jgi:hypothetical protein